MKTISNGILSTSKEVLFTAVTDELIIVQLENEKQAQSTIECGTFTDDVFLAESNGAAMNQRELKIEVKKGEIIFGKASIDGRVGYKIIA